MVNRQKSIPRISPEVMSEDVFAIAVSCAVLSTPWKMSFTSRGVCPGWVEIGHPEGPESAQPVIRPRYTSSALV